MQMSDYWVRKRSEVEDESRRDCSERSNRITVRFIKGAIVG